MALVIPTTQNPWVPIERRVLPMMRLNGIFRYTSVLRVTRERGSLISIITMVGERFAIIWLIVTYSRAIRHREKYDFGVQKMAVLTRGGITAKLD